MFAVDEKETIHLYVVREEVARPSILPVVLSLFTLSLLIVLGTTIPYRQPEERLAIRLPAVFLPLQTFTASEPIIPTGIKTYLATTAHGILTIKNGSVIAQIIPKGFSVSGVATDSAVLGVGNSCRQTSEKGVSSAIKTQEAERSPLEWKRMRR